MPLLEAIPEMPVWSVNWWLALGVHSPRAKLPATEVDRF